jgi:hypothetical protein
MLPPCGDKFKLKIGDGKWGCSMKSQSFDGIGVVMRLAGIEVTAGGKIDCAERWEELHPARRMRRFYHR